MSLKGGANVHISHIDTVKRLRLWPRHCNTAKPTGY